MNDAQVEFLIHLIAMAIRQSSDCEKLEHELKLQYYQLESDNM